MLERVKQTIEKHQLLSGGEKVTVAVSGGPDSIALLHALTSLSTTYRLDLSAVHVNHQLRGEESDADAEYVQTCCQDWKIPCHVVSMDVKAMHSEDKGNLQALARTLRYQAFHRVASQFGANHLALAHHADDQVETVLMRLIRGTGPSGLAGIPICREWKGLRLIRPLWEIWRTEVEDYCKMQGLTPRQDRSNRDRRYTRNRIRLDLIPQLKAYNPRVQHRLFQLSQIVQDEEHFWMKMVEKELEATLIHRNEREMVLDVSSLLKRDIALQRRMIKLILNYLVCEEDQEEITLNSVERILNLATQADPSAQVPLFGGYRAEREYWKLRIVKLSDTMESTENTHCAPVILPIPGNVSFPVGWIRVWVDDRMSLDPADHRAVFDCDRLDLPLVARSRKPGERITPLGLGGSKKVKDVLIDAKIPRRLRAGIPLVLSGEQVIWIPGVCRSDIAGVTDQTRRFLYLEWKWDKEMQERGRVTGEPSPKNT